MDREIRIERFADIPQFTRSGNWECDFDIHYLLKWVAEEEKERGLQLNPDFQRGHVWTTQQQIAFMEYLFRGGRSGRVIYLNKPDWNYSVEEGAYNDYVCVDGLQRITAVRRFVTNEIPVFGTLYVDFKDKPRSKHTLKVNVNDLKTKREVLQWYIDMNAGGKPHADEEIEHVAKMLQYPT